MKLSDQQLIPAPLPEVYEGLNNPSILQQCIPGCQSIEKHSDTEMTALLVLKIGPVKAKYTGEISLSNLHPPTSYTIEFRGQGGAAGFARGSADVQLEAVADQETRLHYDVKADIGGKLAQLGGRLIDSAASSLAGKFFDKFAEALIASRDNASDVE